MMIEGKKANPPIGVLVGQNKQFEDLFGFWENLFYHYFLTFKGKIMN